MRPALERDYEVDGVEYRMSLSELGLMFWITGGVARDGGPALRPLMPGWEDYFPAAIQGDLSRNPVKTLRRSAAIATELVASRRPNYFRFCAESPRRLPLYKRFAADLARKLRYGFHESGGSFYFYRQA